MYYCAVSFFNTLVQAKDKYYIIIFGFGNSTDSEIILIWSSGIWDMKSALITPRKPAGKGTATVLQSE